jgi:hypothetical protein
MSIIKVSWIKKSVRLIKNILPNQIIHWLLQRKLEKQYDDVMKQMIKENLSIRSLNPGHF